MKPPTGNPSRRPAMEFIRRNVYVLSILASILIWSTSFVVTKVSYRSFPPLTLGAARFLLASIVLGILMLARKELSLPPVKDLGWMALSGLFGITGYFALQNIALKMVTASDAALIVACYPAITVLLEFAFYKVKASWVKLLGIALAVGGVYWLSLGGGGSSGGQQTLGSILLVATGFAWTFYNFIAGKVVKKYSMITVSFYQTVAGTIAFIPLALTETSQWKAPSAGDWLALVYLGVFCSIVAFVAYNYGIRKVPYSTAVSMLNLVPVFGVVFSVLLLGESVYAGQLIGGAVVIGGVLLSMGQAAFKPKKQPETMTDSTASG